MKKTISILLFWFVFSDISAQNNKIQILTFETYLAYVKQYHPLVKQAELKLTEGQAKVLKARGSFDPKLEANYQRKDFKKLEYFDVLNSSFKIPTWYGVEFKGGFERNEGEFLNPQLNVPENGLYSAGVSVDIANGLWINKRMAELKKAKLFREQTIAERNILVNKVLFDASTSYFNWVLAYQNLQMLEDFVETAKLRLEGIKRSVIAGDKAEISATEAEIPYQNRLLEMAQSKIDLMKARLELSNFLWQDNNIPLEVKEDVLPENYSSDQVDLLLGINEFQLNEFQIDQHPKMIVLNQKVKQLQVNQKLRINQLLPKIKLEYNFLTPKPLETETFQNSQYKGGITFSYPLFLRKERGKLKLANIKQEGVQFDLLTTQLTLRNKVEATQREMLGYEYQFELIQKNVINYEAMLKAEERKFELGESSLFLVNSREQKLIDSKLKQNSIQFKYFASKAKLFKSLGRLN